MELTIDEHQIEAREGETILECARRHGIDIPHICAHPMLPPYGACRLCIVEVDGMRGYPTSCTTPAVAGMVIRTATDALQDLRRRILELILLEHPNACLVCTRRDACREHRSAPTKAGRTTGCATCKNEATCEIARMAVSMGIDSLNEAPFYRDLPLEREDPFLRRDYNLCILCGRCARICKELHGNATIDFQHRGKDARVGTPFGESHVEAGCRFCGACVDVCPTGSLADRYARWAGASKATAVTTCAYCPAGCAVEVVTTSGGQLTAVKSLHPGEAICVLGRFAMPEFLNDGARLVVPKVRVQGRLREVPWEQALSEAARLLDHSRGEAFAAVVGYDSTEEERYLLERFTREVMQSPNFIAAGKEGSEPATAALPDSVRAVYLAGNLVTVEALQRVEVLVLQDLYPSAAMERAQVVLPTTALAEVEGSRIADDGKRRLFYARATPPGEVRQGWRIISDLAGALGAPGLAYDDIEALRGAAGSSGGGLAEARMPRPAPVADYRQAPRYHRGHRIAERVRGLVQLEQAAPKAAAAPDAPIVAPKRFQIVDKEEMVPNVHRIVVHAPDIARKAKPGLFLIVMVDARSERVPYTIADWDAESGNVTLVVIEAGHSSRKLALCRRGDVLEHVVGPLGEQFPVEKYGHVVLAGGCYGIGAVYSLARALRQAGNTVTTIAEARSAYLHYFGDELAAVSDTFLKSTADGSLGERGHAVDVINRLVAEGRGIDKVVAVGCTFMMEVLADMTRQHGLSTLVALNSIMVDGTGMCGACRLNYAGEMKFTCVDGPFFDAHQVDWSELRDRKTAYGAEEIRSVSRSASPTFGTSCSCR